MNERTCAICSSVFTPRTSRQIYCGKSCNGKATYRRRVAANPLPLSSEFACPVCGDRVPSRKRTGPQATYCSRNCRQLASYYRNREEILARRKLESEAKRSNKKCRECGDKFTAMTSAKQAYCSKKCAKRWQNRHARELRPPCSEEGCKAKSIAAGLCRKHNPNAASWSRGTTEARRVGARKRTQRRRALTRDPDADLIDRDDVGERDGWKCGLCGRKVNRLLAYPHPRSASLDHIAPLSLGGCHVLTNVQISHLECNLAKGNRGGGEQLLLIG